MAASFLAELLGGKYRSRILELLFLNPQESFHLRGITAGTGVPPASLHALLPRLAHAGLIRVIEASGTKRYQANMELPGADELARLLSRHALPTRRLKEVSASLEGVVAAAVFGSYASGTARAESDIDVLVVGDVSRVDAHAAFRGVARELKREINVTTLSLREFRQQSRSPRSFVAGLLAKPTLPLKGMLDAAAKR